jgi:predicted DNA-binding transcriptional regulator AlpA
MQSNDNRAQGRMTNRERQELVLTNPHINPDALLNVTEVAALLGCSVQQLNIGRKVKQTTADTVVKNLPPCRILFSKMVRYRYGDVVEWIERNKRNDQAA